MRKKQKPKKPKPRKTWKISPATRVEQSKKSYSRSREREMLKEQLDDGDSEQE